MLNFRSFQILLMCVVLGGCATEIKYPDKVVFSPYNTIDTLRQSAIRLHSSYRTNIDALQSDTNKNAIYNIGNGFVLAASAIYGAPKDLISGLGLVAGTNAVANTTFSQQSQLSIYEAGYSALGCVLNASTKLPDASVGFNARAAKLRKIKFDPLPPLGESLDINTRLREARLVAVLELAREDAVRISEKAAKTLNDADLAKKNSEWTFASNLNFLDRSVRKKLRETLTSRESKAIGDDLLKQIRAGEKEAADARSLIFHTEHVLAGLSTDPQRSIVSSLVDDTVTDLEKAAIALEFDATLKKCILSAGL